MRGLDDFDCSQNDVIEFTTGIAATRDTKPNDDEEEDWSTVEEGVAEGMKGEVEVEEKEEVEQRSRLATDRGC